MCFSTVLGKSFGKPQRVCDFDPPNLANQFGRGGAGSFALTNSGERKMLAGSRADASSRPKTTEHPLVQIAQVEFLE